MGRLTVVELRHDLVSEQLETVGDVGMGVLAAPVWTFWIGVVLVLFAVIPALLMIIVGYFISWIFFR